MRDSRLIEAPGATINGATDLAAALADLPFEPVADPGFALEPGYTTKR